MHAALGRRFDDVNAWLGYAPGPAGIGAPAASTWDIAAIANAAQPEPGPTARARDLKRWLIAASMRINAG